MSGFRSFLKRHPVLAYYVLVFAISWGRRLAGARTRRRPGDHSHAADAAARECADRYPRALHCRPAHDRPALREAGPPGNLSRPLKWRVG